MSPPAAIGRELRSRGVTPGTSVWRANELPAVLPWPPVTDLGGEVQQGQPLERARHHERAGVDWPEADRLDELEHYFLGCLVVTGHEAFEFGAIHCRVGHADGTGGVERFHDRP